MRREGYLVSDTPGHGREVGLGPLIFYPNLIKEHFTACLRRVKSFA